MWCHGDLGVGGIAGLWLEHQVPGRRTRERSPRPLGAPFVGSPFFSSPLLGCFVLCEKLIAFGGLVENPLVGKKLVLTSTWWFGLVGWSRGAKTIYPQEPEVQILNYRVGVKTEKGHPSLTQATKSNPSEAACPFWKTYLWSASLVVWWFGAGGLVVQGRFPICQNQGFRSESSEPPILGYLIFGGADIK